MACSESFTSTRKLSVLWNKIPAPINETMIPRAAEREEEFSSFAIHQQHADDRHQKIDQREKRVGKVRMQIGKTGLDENSGVVTDDGIDAGELVAGEDDAGHHKRDDIFAAQQGFLDLCAGGPAFSASMVAAISCNSISACVSLRERSKAVRAASFLPLRNSQRGRFRNHETADDE